MTEANSGRSDGSGVADFMNDMGLGTLRQSFEEVGGYLHAGLSEVAEELGGEELTSRIAALAATESVLPNPAALQALENIQKGAARRVMDRAGEIQREAHKRERAELLQPGFLKYAGSVIRGITRVNLFSSASRK